MSSKDSATANPKEAAAASPKDPTIGSLTRIAGRSEADFVQAVQLVMELGDAEKIAEFFDKLNISRTQGLDEGTGPQAAIRRIAVAPASVTAAEDRYEHERLVSNGVQKFMDRHERKIKWHSSNPSEEGIANVLLLFRFAIALTEMRLERLEILLKSQDELTPEDWSIARELMNRSFLTFRNYLRLVSADWLPNVQPPKVKPEAWEANVQGFYSLVFRTVDSLNASRTRMEERRQQLTVQPRAPFPPVKAPPYFGGDLLNAGPWKQFSAKLTHQADQLRAAMG